jgi:hypothetical protein
VGLVEGPIDCCVLRYFIRARFARRGDAHERTIGRDWFQGLVDTRSSSTPLSLYARRDSTHERVPTCWR